MKGYFYLLSTPLIAFGAVDTSGHSEMTDISRVRGDIQAPVPHKPADSLTLPDGELLSAAVDVAVAKTSSRAFSKAVPGRRYAAAEISSPVSSAPNLRVVAAKIAFAAVSPGSEAIALPAPTIKEPKSNAISVTETPTAGTSKKFIRLAAVSIDTVPEVERLIAIKMVADRPVASLRTAITRVTKGSTIGVNPKNSIGTTLKASKLSVGNGQSVMGQTSPADLMRMTYGTSAHNAHKVYFPKQIEISAGASGVDRAKGMGSVETDQGALSIMGGDYHREDSANGQETNTKQTNGRDVALNDNRSDQPKSSVNGKAETLSEHGDAVDETVSLNQSLEAGSVY